MNYVHGPVEPTSPTPTFIPYLMWCIKSQVTKSSSTTPIRRLSSYALLRQNDKVNKNTAVLIWYRKCSSRQSVSTIQRNQMILPVNPCQPWTTSPSRRLQKHKPGLYVEDWYYVALPDSWWSHSRARTIAYNWDRFSVQLGSILIFACTTSIRIKVCIEKLRYK